MREASPHLPSDRLLCDSTSTLMRSQHTSCEQLWMMVMSGSAHFESLAKMFHQGEQKVSFGGVPLVCFFDLFSF